MAGVIPVKLAYEVCDPIGEDATMAQLIFLHGLGGSKKHWEDTMPLYANETKRKAYAIDARNHGDSEWSDVFNFDINADDLLHFMDTHNIPKAVLVGESMGGITGIRTALKKPERVEKLIVVDMCVKKVPQAIWDAIAISISQIQESLDNLPSNLDEDEAKRKVFEDAFQRLPVEMKDMMKKPPSNKNVLILKKKPDGGYTLHANIPAILRALKDTDTLMSEPKGSYSGPACFIYGELTPLLQEGEENHIKQFFPQADFVCIKGAGHAISNDCPTELREAIIQYLLKN